MATEQLEVGATLFDRYILKQKIAEGAGGAVFRAFDAYADQVVALKAVVDKFDRRKTLDLRREFTLFRSIANRNLVRLRNLHSSTDLTVLTMEHLTGPTLTNHLRGILEARGSSAVTDEVREVLLQVGGALEAIHQRQLVHRDVKPDNIVVRKTASSLEYVLLDFGLGNYLERRGASVAGTPGFIAPEVLSSAEPAGIPSDWYGLGKACEHALTQLLGSGWERLEAASEVSALIGGLTAPEPAQRSAFQDVALLNGGAGYEVESSKRTRALVGRSAEIGLLRSLTDGRHLELNSIFVIGRSGMGKTALLGAVARGSGASSRIDLSVACNRCEENYFGVLGLIVDELAEYLKDKHFFKLLNLHHSSELRSVFRALDDDEVFGIKQEVRSSEDLRLKAVQALREVFRRLSEDRPVNIWIDDAQWASEPDARLLQEFLSTDEAPLLNLTILSRSLDSDFVEAMSSWCNRYEFSSTQVDINALTDEEGLQLASKLAPDADVDTLSAAVRLASGNPFMLNQILTSGVRATSFDVWLRTQEERLSPVERKIFIYVCLSGNPVSFDTLQLIFGDLSQRELDDRISSLLSLGWINDSSSIEQRRFECENEELRSLFFNQLTEDERAEAFVQLATAMESQPNPSLGTIAYLLEQAGELENAAAWCGKAALQAFEEHAYEAASHHLEKAIAFSEAERRDPKTLTMLATALTGAGRRDRAAEVYADAANELEQRDQFEKAAFSRAAAVAMYMSAGLGEKAKSSLKSLHGFLNLRSWSVRYAGILRYWFLIRNYSFRPNPTGSVDVDQLARLEALTEVAKTTAMVDHRLFDSLSLVHLKRAMAIGDNDFVLSCLAMEASRLSTVGGPYLQKVAGQLINRASDLLVNPDVQRQAIFGQCQATVLYNVGDWRGCIEHVHTARELYINQCEGVSWELAAMDAYYFGALAQTGDLLSLREERKLRVSDATARGDHFAMNLYNSFDLVLDNLANDDSRVASRNLERAIAKFETPEFSTQWYYYLTGALRVSLYEGDYDKAWRMLTGKWDALEQAGFLKLECISLLLRRMRALIALGLSEVQPRLLEVARKEAKTISRSRLSFASPFARVIRATLKAMEGQEETARSELRAAVKDFRSCQMALDAAFCQLRLAELSSGQEQTHARESAYQYLVEQQIKDPDAFSRMYVA